jgi:hypothetical protein
MNSAVSKAATAEPPVPPPPPPQKSSATAELSSSTSKKNRSTVFLFSVHKDKYRSQNNSVDAGRQMIAFRQEQVFWPTNASSQPLIPFGATVSYPGREAAEAWTWLIPSV